MHSQTVCTALGGLANDLGKTSGILQHGGQKMIPTWLFWVKQVAHLFIRFAAVLS